MKAAFALALIVFSASPALAQREQQTGSRFTVPKPARDPEDPSLSVSERGRVTLALYAACILERDAAKAKRALQMPYGAESDKAISRLAVNDCLRSGMLQFQGVSLRGALYNELYRREFGTNVPRAESVAFDFGQSAPNLDKDVAGRIGLLMFGDCVLRASPAMAHAFVVAHAAGSAEDAAFVQIEPELGPCLPQGQQIALNRLTLKGVLSEVLYRRATAPAVAETK